MTVDDLLNVGAHVGYAKTRRNPHMKKFIAGVKSNVEIFNAERILKLLEEALTCIEGLGKEGAQILWIGTKPAAAPTIRAVAERLGHPFVDTRWIGGTFTNFKVIRDRINYWQSLVSKKAAGTLEKYTKQEQMLFGKDIEKLTRTFEGLVRLETLPKAVFIVDTNKEINALRESRQKNIPVVALLNTDCDPESVAYAIPANDNAPKSIAYILECAKDAYLKGRETSDGAA